MEESGRVVGDYVLLDKIGSGSFAVVWRARSKQSQSGDDVAVKEIDKKRVDRKDRDGLLKEIDILRHVSHPNIVRLYDAIQTEDKLFLVLEYCAGGDLAEYIQKQGNRGRVSEDFARHFMRQLAEGLKVLRENNLIHRDLKPQNLLLSTNDKAPILKIGDFGFARYLTPQSLADTLCGSPLYMAPEIMQDRKYDAKADLWSVGAILFQLVTGKLPFDGNTHYQLFQNIMASEDLKFPPEILNHLNPDCIHLCKGLLRRNPVERLSFEEFFNHKFLAETRISASIVEPVNTSIVRKDSCYLTSNDIFSKRGESTEEPESSHTKNSKVSDSLDSLEREYVIVHPHFASMETLSSISSLERSNSLPTSQELTGLEDKRESVFNPLNRLRILSQYITVLTEVAHEKLVAGSDLESFSVELVILAVWKEALHACTSWIAPTANKGEIPIDYNFPLNKNLLDYENNEADLAEEYTQPLSVYSWAERGFISACDRAEEISIRLQENYGNVEMPDAMEIIFQTALAAGKNGAVDELMGNGSRAVTSYSKAIMLLMFIMIEATSLPLNPPFSLSPSNQCRLQKYITNLKNHLCSSQMTTR